MEDRPDGSSRVRRADDPFARLERSHRRIEEACDALARAARDRDIETISDVCAFFSRQVQRHEADEELSVFPRLNDTAARPMIERLSHEHRAHEELHERLVRLLSGRDAVDGQRDTRSIPDVWPALEALAQEIAGAYHAHIEDEERELFPMARRLLSVAAAEEIVGEMEARRGR